MECSVLDGTLYQALPPTQGPGIISGCEMLSSGHEMAMELMTSQQLWLTAQDLYKSKMPKFQNGWGGDV